MSKRMGTALKKLVMELKAGKESISGKGKGKLTQDKILKIQNYYGRAIKDNADDVPLLKKRIFAILFHLSSTDKEPKHIHCPPGEKSWCFWQRAEANSVAPGPHKDHETLSPEIGAKLVPIFTRLSNTDLLIRCTRNKTQNPNESLHHLVWKFCPKATYAGLKTMETAVTLAVCQFQMGASFRIVLCRILGIQPGVNLAKSSQEKDMKRLRKAEKKCSTPVKKRRRQLKYKSTTNDQKNKEKEGSTYLSGGFNS